MAARDFGMLLRLSASYFGLFLIDLSSVVATAAQKTTAIRAEYALHEGDDRKEEKLDAILKHVDPDGADALIRKLSAKYPKQ